MIWKLFDGDVPDVSTFAFHESRDRARHLEEPEHTARLHLAAELVKASAQRGASTCSDLGCGDGGLLSLVRDDIDAWGYDFTPANAEGWPERGVKAEALDVFGAGRDQVRFGDVTVVTEVLEHIADPFGAVEWIGEHSRFIVASSPHDETPMFHDTCHAWAFDRFGYRDLITGGGYRILRHETVDMFQVVWGCK